MLLDTMRNTGTAPCTTQTGSLVFFISVSKGMEIQEQLKPDSLKIIFFTDLSPWNGSVCDLKNMYDSVYCLPYF